MPRKRAFAIYAPEVKQHLRAITPKYCSLIRATIEDQLRFEPDIATRSRKPLQQPAAFEAAWELRCGPENRFRLFYRVDQDRQEVQALAVGVKERNRLFIGGEEIEL
ncbi:MAG: addiction module toxin RelE [Isosphaeraceae bacterium]|nr:addiction module toxin RelE [Isosphaeraceae bacterium]